MRDAFETWKGRGQFAGHETFPLRLLWLKKVHDAVGTGVAAGTFHDPAAIARFGVGRNMAVSMRFWALAAGMMEEEDKQLVQTEIAKSLLSNQGWDPYLEDPATLWLVHWNFAAHPELTTTIYFGFNAVPALEFTAPSLVQGIEELVKKRGWRGAPVTLRRDVEVFLRSYARRDDTHTEDAAEPLLAELGLIRAIKPGNWFEFVRGPKPTLPDAVFAYALDRFWLRHHGGRATLSAELICYAPGSPGRVFKLDEDSVIARLMRIEEFTGGALRWSDTAGLRQMHRERDMDPLNMLSRAYPKSASVRDA